MVQLLHPYMTAVKTVALTTASNYMDLCFAKWCLCFLICCLVCHVFLSKEQTSFNVTPAIIIHSNFGAQENKSCPSFPFFPINLPWNDGTRCHDLHFFFEHWVLCQLFHSRLSPLSRGSLVLLHFLPLECYHLYIWGCWYFSQKFWFQLVTHPASQFT